MAKLGEEFPDFTSETNHGPISFHHWLGDSWGMLFSHPADYTPVCTTELAKVLELQPEFAKRNVKLIALSCDRYDRRICVLYTRYNKVYETVRLKCRCLPAPAKWLMIFTNYQNPPFLFQRRKSRRVGT